MKWVLCEIADVREVLAVAISVGSVTDACPTISTELNSCGAAPGRHAAGALSGQPSRPLRDVLFGPCRVFDATHRNDQVLRRPRADGTKLPGSYYRYG